MKFTLKRREQPVEIDGKKFTLRELTGRERAAFFEAAKAKKRGETGVSLEALVIGFSLVDEAGVTVAAEVVDGWPATVVGALSGRVGLLSGLTEEPDEAAGNA